MKSAESRLAALEAVTAPKGPIIVGVDDRTTAEQLARIEALRAAGLVVLPMAPRDEAL